MNSKQISIGILRAVGVILGIALMLYLLYQIQIVIVYIAIASVIALMGRPVVVFFRERLKLKNIFAVILTMILLVALFAGLIGLFVPLVIEQGQNLSLLNIEELEQTIASLYQEVLGFFELNNIDVKRSFEDLDILSKIDYTIIPNFLNALVSGLGNFSIGLFSVIFISFFFLKDSKLLENGMLSFIPDDMEASWIHSSNKIKNLLSRYFVGLTFQILILFVIYTIGLLIIGIDNPIVIAFLCALLNVIPYVGPIIGLVLMITLTMTSNLGENFGDVILAKSLFVLIVFAIGQLIDNFFSQPYIFSKSVKSHPLEIFLVILIAGILFGVLGLIVAIPVYTVIKVISKEFLSEYKIVRKLTKGL